VLLSADSDHCAICGALFTEKVYVIEDKVTGEKVQVCPDCTLKRERCFFCGLPVKIDDTKLPDGRSICLRDAKTAVLDDATAQQVVHETSDGLDRLFSRFMSFPETNVSVKLVDRVNLQILFKEAGDAYSCPNVWGYTQTKPKKPARFDHRISLLTGLPAATLKATCAHEYTHTWLNEHLSPARKKTIDSDAIEGFCELIAYLLSDAQGNEQEVSLIKRNAYTRGQIDLLIEAERTYGLSDIIDWMQYGTDGRLEVGALDRIRNVELPKGRSVGALPVYQTAAVKGPETLLLKGISGTAAHPFALINEHTFEENEQATVHVGTTNLMIRCLSIRGGKVKVLLLGSGKTEELVLKQAAQP
jgi:hypothetical protein